MSQDYDYTPEEQQRNRVLKYQFQQLKDIHFNMSDAEDCISESEELLSSLGYEKKIAKQKQKAKEKAGHRTRHVKVMPEWEELCKEANAQTPEKVSLTDFFTEEELSVNRKYIEKLNDDYNAIHRLDKTDWTICVVAGIVSAAVDILFVGIPERSKTGTKAGALSNYIRSYFEKKFPPEEMEMLGGKHFVKTPYDAQDNRNTTVYVDGLSTYYHRLLSLGHDPILGFIVGVMDIMRGTMTTIDKKGKIVSQVMDVYTDRKETNLFEALTKHLLHLKSDLTTSMGLPVPLMGLFNLLQFGSIGEEKQTIAEIVQGMYYEGYDFIHFCSMSIPVMLTEIIVRLCWCIKRIKEGYTLKESLPYSTNRETKPKLATMLFIAHSAATAINAGKVAFTENPMAINYPQWLAFGKYAFSQLQWSLIQKPQLRDRYVMQIIEEERTGILEEINKNYNEFICSSLEI